MKAAEDPREHAREALYQARKAARRGDHASAERWTKTADRLTEAARRFAELPKEEVENVDELRAELAERLAAFTLMASHVAEVQRITGRDISDEWGYTERDLIDTARGRRRLTQDDIEFMYPDGVPEVGTRYSCAAHAVALGVPMQVRVPSEVKAEEPPLREERGRGVR